MVVFKIGSQSSGKFNHQFSRTKGQAPAHHSGPLDIRLFLSAPLPSTQKDGLKGALGIGSLHGLLGEHDQGEVKVKLPKMSLNFLSMGPWKPLGKT